MYSAFFACSIALSLRSVPNMYVGMDEATCLKKSFVKIAIELKAERIIFGSDVDGVFTSNPKLNSDAELITQVSLRNINANVSDTTFTDVTGGMMGKVTEAEEAVKAGSKVLFLNATAKDRVKMALKGEKVMGTILTL